MRERGIELIRQVGDHSISLGADLWRVIDQVQNGDGLIGWSGDPNMTVCFNEQERVYEIWRWHEGLYYFVLSAPPHEFDNRVIMRLAAGDTHRRDVLADLDKHNESIRRDEERQAEAMEEEIRDVLKYYYNKNS